MKRTATSVNPDNLPVVEELAPHEIVERQVMRIIGYAIFCAGRDCVYFTRDCVFEAVSVMISLPKMILIGTLRLIEIFVIYPILGLFPREWLDGWRVDAENAKMAAGICEGLLCCSLAAFLLKITCPLSSNPALSEFMYVSISCLMMIVLGIGGFIGIAFNCYGGYFWIIEDSSGRLDVKKWNKVERGPMVFRYLFSPFTSFFKKRYELAENELIQKLIEERKKGASGEMVRE